MKVKDVMKKEFIKLSPNDIGGDVAYLFVSENLLYAPVIEDDELVGWITSLDILSGCKHSKVEDLMRYLDEIKIVKEDDDLLEVTEEMIKNKDIAYPVVDENNKVVGVIDVFSILKVLSKNISQDI
ncbi:putative signal transduction protein with CBS domains [Methanocaldococcus infernus ME]|uniref:Signal transduction protein with CBS domains n=1 Tax=Methanocaldococcus infernus (strain DSM 11812 / JCM 15783 / ME) TaxID=573063 RepID=D5VRI7_METIM|nr:CBS domain-containing protein [Methanocaldococcus infernus]ADG13190.1 putative signal transduction protein with CBS domains [Methanocaldococcus infernus ME]